MVDLEDVRRRHTRNGIAQDDPFEFICTACRTPWPCDASRLADEVERLRKALRAVADEGCNDDRCQGDCGYWIAREALAQSETPTVSDGGKE